MVDGSGSLSVMDIRQLIQEHHASVYRYAFRLAGSQADAEDLAQQAFLIAQQKLHQVRHPERIRGWLLAITRTCFLKSRRKAVPVSASSIELSVDEIPADAVEQADIDSDELQAALDRLPDESRVVLVLFYFQDLSYKEIAAELDVPMGTVMSRLSRAKGRLRHLLLAGDADSNPATPAPQASTRPSAR